MTTLAPTAAIDFTKKLVPGLLVTALVAMAAAFLGSHYKGSMLLFALLLGLALHFVSEDKRCAAGIQFASSTVLRLGVALLGLRLTIDHVVTLGWQTVVALLVAVGLTIVLGLLLARVFKLDSSLGLLIGGATAICGASAALAISSVLPRSAHLERDTTLTVVSVTTLSTMAMVVYPLITQWLGFDAVTAGKFIGATIHDVAQVVGAGYTIDQATGDYATIVKLFRVSMLAVVVVMVSALFKRQREAAAEQHHGKKPGLVPWFLWVFVALVAINSLGWVPPGLQHQLSDLSRNCLVLAIAALGLKTSFQQLAQAGWRPFALLVVETLWMAAFVLIAIEIEMR